MIETEQTAEPFASDDVAIEWSDAVFRSNENVVDPAAGSFPSAFQTADEARVVTLRSLLKASRVAPSPSEKPKRKS